MIKFFATDDGLRLLPGSPCIDAAAGDAAPLLDILGNARHDDSRISNSGTGLIRYADIGAYELQVDSILCEIAGTVWNDLDRDGRRDINEPGLEGWTIRLDGGQRTAITDASGSYLFKNVDVGSHLVEETAPDGWNGTAPIGGRYTLDFKNRKKALRVDFGHSVALAEPRVAAVTRDITAVGLNLFDDLALPLA